ncbi:hypothetical protein F7725_000738, partial [Dissostichus mawsoni]
MADSNSRVTVKRKEKKVENKAKDEKDKEKEKGKGKEKVVKKPDKPVKPVKTVKKEETTPEQPKAEEEKANGESEGATGAEPEANVSEENGEYQPIELPPFEIVTGEQMSPFYFKFQFRNVEYSSGRNKTLLCFRVDTPGGSTEPLRGYMEDEHATAHAEEAFFQQLAIVLQQRKKVHLSMFISRLFEWEEPEIVEGLRALASAGCKLRMMKPSDFVHLWETYVEKEEEIFEPWEDCQENYEYYVEKLADIL